MCLWFDRWRIRPLIRNICSPELTNFFPDGGPKPFSTALLVVDRSPSGWRWAGAKLEGAGRHANGSDVSFMYSHLAEEKSATIVVFRNWLNRARTPERNGWNSVARCVAHFSSPTIRYAYFYYCGMKYYSICERNGTLLSQIWDDSWERFWPTAFSCWIYIWMLLVGSQGVTISTTLVDSRCLCLEVWHWRGRGLYNLTVP